MPIEIRGLIEPIDIKSIEFECTTCHARHSRPVDAVHVVPTECPSCKAQWFVRNSAEYVRLPDLQDILLTLAQMPGTFPCKMRFEVTGLKQQ